MIFPRSHDVRQTENSPKSRKGIIHLLTYHPQIILSSLIPPEKSLSGFWERSGHTVFSGPCRCIIKLSHQMRKPPDGMAGYWPGGHL